MLLLDVLIVGAACSPSRPSLILGNFSTIVTLRKSRSCARLPLVMCRLPGDPCRYRVVGVLEDLRFRRNGHTHVIGNYALRCLPVFTLITYNCLCTVIFMCLYTCKFPYSAYISLKKTRWGRNASRSIQALEYFVQMCLVSHVRYAFSHISCTTVHIFTLLSFLKLCLNKVH